eukprot:gene8547-biopygen13679
MSKTSSNCSFSFGVDNWLWTWSYVSTETITRQFGAQHNVKTRLAQERSRTSLHRKSGTGRGKGAPPPPPVAWRNFATPPPCTGTACVVVNLSRNPHQSHQHKHTLTYAYGYLLWAPLGISALGETTEDVGRTRTGRGLYG